MSGMLGFQPCCVIHLKVKLLVPQSCLTLWNPMGYSPSGSSVHGILQARILELVAMTLGKQLLICLGFPVCKMGRDFIDQMTTALHPGFLHDSWLLPALPECRGVPPTLRMCSQSESRALCPQVPKEFGGREWSPRKGLWTGYP